MLEIRVSDTLAIPSFANRLGDVTLVGALGVATEAEAKAGVAPDKWITPLRITNALREDGYINPKRFFGAKFDFVTATQTGTDDTQAWLDAIDESLEAIATGEPERAEIIAPPGASRVTETLNFTTFSMKQRGKGRYNSEIVLDHDGVGVRFHRSDWALEDIGIVGSTARAALPFDNLAPAVLLQGPGGGTINFGGQLKNVVVDGHHSHGIVIIGAGILMDLPEVRNCKGHGIAIDAGRLMGLTGGDLHAQGFGTHILSPRCAFNGGHGVVVGHPDDTSSVFVLRVRVENLDSFGNATDVAVRYTEDDSFMHGEDLLADQCGQQGGNGGAGACWTLAGKSVHAIRQRSVDGAAVTARAIQYAGILAADLIVDIERVIGSPAQDPAVIIDASVPDFVVNAFSRATSNITNLTSTSPKPSHTRLGVQQEFRGGRTGMDSLYGTLLGTVGDDQVLKVQLNASITGMFAIWASSTTGRAALIFAGVGSSPFCNIMAESFNVTPGTGALTAGAGAGVDGELNIHAHTDDCLYLGNRTGGSRTLHLMMLTQTNARVTGVTLLV